jgi:acetyl esterase
MVVLEKIAQDFIDDLNEKDGPPLYTLEPKDARELLIKIQSGKVDTYENEFETVPIHNGDASIIFIKPKALKNIYAAPCVIYYHGAGWILGGYETHKRLVNEIAHKANVIVAFLEYQLAPEANYKHILVQASDTIDYVVNNGAKHGIDINKLILAGDSVGGNMTIAMTLVDKTVEWPKFLHQILAYPVTSAAMDTESYKTYADGPWLTAEAMKWFWNAYAPEDSNVSDLRNQYFISPLNANPEDLVDVPPALVITDENDVLRDEGEAYAHKLMLAGINVVAVRYLGIMHDFLMLNALTDANATKSAMCLIIDTIKKCIQ